MSRRAERDFSLNMRKPSRENLPTRFAAVASEKLVLRTMILNINGNTLFAHKKVILPLLVFNINPSIMNCNFSVFNVKMSNSVRTTGVVTVSGLSVIYDRLVLLPGL